MDGKARLSDILEMRRRICKSPAPVRKGGLHSSEDTTHCRLYSPVQVLVDGYKDHALGEEVQVLGPAGDLLVRHLPGFENSNIQMFRVSNRSDGW